MVANHLETVSQYTFFSLHGEDAAGVLTFSITFVALLVSSAYLSCLQVIGQPIECWCPAQLSNAMCNYTKSLCWISRQYVIDYDSNLPAEEELRQQTSKRIIDFYPMVPFILLSLAFILRLPHFLYGCLHVEAGLNIHSLLKSSVTTNLSLAESARDVCRSIRVHLKAFRLAQGGGAWVHPGSLHPASLSSRSSSSRSSRSNRSRRRDGLVPWLGQWLTGGLFFFLGERFGTYQTGLYLAARLTTLVLIAATFPGLSFVLKEDFTTWGWVLFKKKVINADLSNPPGVSTEDKEFYFFPRETLCDFKVRQMQNVHAYTVQCVLPINIWSEKVFLCLWYWLLFLFLVNLYSYVYWLRKMLFASKRWAVVRKHLTLAGVNGLGQENSWQYRRAEQFASRYLTHDCVLAVNMLEMASGNQFACEVVAALYRAYDAEDFSQKL